MQSIHFSRPWHRMGSWTTNSATLNPPDVGSQEHEVMRTLRHTCPWTSLGCKLHSKTPWFKEFCNSHYVSHFVSFFIIEQPRYLLLRVLGYYKSSCRVYVSVYSFVGFLSNWRSRNGLTKRPHVWDTERGGGPHEQLEEKRPHPRAARAIGMTTLMTRGIHYVPHLTAFFIVARAEISVERTHWLL